MFAGIDWNAILNSTDRLGILLGVGGPLLIMAIGLWFRYTLRRAEIDLKRRMVERGFAPDEIERVVLARRGTKKPTDEA